jgi:hypothetical protein
MNAIVKFGKDFVLKGIQDLAARWVEDPSKDDKYQILTQYRKDLLNRLGRLLVLVVFARILNPTSGQVLWVEDPSKDDKYQKAAQTVKQVLAVLGEKVSQIYMLDLVFITMTPNSGYNLKPNQAYRSD